jgi:hypothetical protein
LIAWLSHHLPDKDGNLVGGAEMTDQTFLANAPVEVKIISPDKWQEALDFDKVIITGTDLLAPNAMKELAKVNPVVAIHHLQTKTYERQVLLSSASNLICRTPRHLELELSWTNPKQSTWVVSPLDPSQFTSKPKENFALWAARLHPQKGPMEAMDWASQNLLPLLMLYNKPREIVLEAMSRAKHFVFLPQGFDAEPRAVVEAVLSGCKVHTNDLAGITSIKNWDKPDVLAGLVSNAIADFWDKVLA